MFGKTKEKKKLSIDFKEDNYNTLVDFAQSSGESNSNIINYLVSHFLNLSLDTRKAFAKCCSEELRKEEEKYSSLGEFEKIKASKRINLYKDLIKFFTDGKGSILDEKTKMKKIDIFDGYVIFPNDWIIIENQNPNDSNFVGVIEVRNAKKYNIPHFLFFSKFPIRKLSAFDEKIILEHCENAYSDFKKIISMQVEPVYDNNNNILNIESWREAPHIGFFQIGEYGRDSVFPANAMIIRNKA